MRGRRRDGNLKHLDHLAAAGIHGVDHMDGVDGWLPRGWIQNDLIRIASWCRGDIDASGGDSSTTNSYMQGWIQNDLHPVRLAYQPPASSTFLSEQISHQQPASSTFLSEQISTNHQPPAKRTDCLYG
jgi:hypothetical protein